MPMRHSIHHLPHKQQNSAKQRARWANGGRSTPHGNRPPVIDEMPPMFAPNGAPPMAQPGYIPPPAHYPPLLFSSFYYSGFHPISPQQPVSPMAFYPQHAFDMGAAPYGPPSPMAPAAFPPSPHAPYHMHGPGWAPGLAAAPYPGPMAVAGVVPMASVNGGDVDLLYHKHASGSTVGDGTVGGSHESDASHEESVCEDGRSGGSGSVDFTALLQQAQHVHVPPPQEVMLGGVEWCMALYYCMFTMVVVIRNAPLHPPPFHTQLIDLVALLTSYGVLHEVSPLLQYAAPDTNASAPPPSSNGGSSDQLKKPTVNKFRHPPRFAVDGTLILNARQRRTLRRAQDRAAHAIAAIINRTDGDDTSGASVHSRQVSSDSGGGAQPCRPPAEVMLLQALPGTTLAHVAAMVAPHLPPLSAPTPPMGVNSGGGGIGHKPRGASRFAPGEHGVVHHHHHHSHSMQQHHNGADHRNGNGGDHHHVRASSEGMPKRTGGDALQVWATATAW